MNKQLPKHLYLGIAPLILLMIILLSGIPGLFALAGVYTAKAAPAKQAYIYTPTPGPDGRIIYLVKPNDTLLGISLLTGISVEKLRELNNLSGDTIYEGQKLLLGLAGPPEVTVTPGPTLTPTPIVPTPTLKPGKGNLCILLFNDMNGDSIRQEDEPSIPEGAISFSNRLGTVSESVNTGSGLEPQCFKDLAEGDYTISVAVPEGYNPTTANSYELALKSGDETYLNFGAQANSQTLAQAPIIPNPDKGRSPILGIVGVLFLLAGAGVAVFARRMLKSR